MYLVAVAWVYVVLMMALVEATGTGTVLGAIFTFLLYGVLPLGVVMYLLGTPARRRARRLAEARVAVGAASVAQPDGSDHAAGDPLAAVRKEP